MKQNRVERHIIKKNNKGWKIVDGLCFKSKNIYNYANFIIRQEFINNNKWLRYNELDMLLKNSEPYMDLGSKCSQSTLRMLDRNWSSFFKSIKDWSKNKEKYLGKPKLPKYKEKQGRYPLLITNQQCKIKDEYVRFGWHPLKPLNNIFKTNIKNKLIQIRFIPRGSDYVMEVVYEVDVPDLKLEVKNIIGIDLGIDNFATISNNIGLQPIIINGRVLKSINQYYNKRSAKLISDLKKKHNKNWSNRLQRLTSKRNNKIEDFMHKSSKYIVDYCINNNIDTIVIGKNKNWKQECNIGKRNNQNFIGIPFDSFINKLKYKCENKGINLIKTEESYTSGTSFLDFETSDSYNYNKSRRITRGLFKSNDGILINADLNGSYQIMKKVFPNAFANGIEGVGLHPVRLII